MNESNNIEEAPTTRKTLKWIFEQNFTTINEKNKYFESQKIWSVSGSTVISTGKNIYYRCNRVKRDGPQCTARKYVFESNTTTDFILYKTADDHDHENLPSKNVSENVRNTIINLHKNGMKPRQIYNFLNENPDHDKGALPTLKRIQSIVTYAKKKRSVKMRFA